MRMPEDKSINIFVEPSTKQEGMYAWFTVDGKFESQPFGTPGKALVNARENGFIYREP